MRSFFCLKIIVRPLLRVGILFLANPYARAEDLGAAIKTYIKILQNQAAYISEQDISELVSDLFIQGLVEMSTNQYDKAFESINNAIKLDPSNACLHYKMAQILEKSPKFCYKRRFILDAISHMYAAIELSENTKQYYYSAITMHLNSNQINDAINIYEQMIKKFAPTASELFSLADLYMKVKNFKQAIKVYSQLEQRLGVVQEIINEKHKAFMAMQEMEMAISEKLKLCSSLPDNQENIVELALLLKENEEDYVAIDYLKGHIAVYPYHFNALELLIEFIFDKNLIEELEPYITTFIKSNVVQYYKKVEILDAFTRKIADDNGFELLENLIKLMISQYPYQETYMMCADLYKILGDEVKCKELTKKARSFNAVKSVGYYTAS